MRGGHLTRVVHLFIIARMIGMERFALLAVNRASFSASAPLFWWADSPAQ